MPAFATPEPISVTIDLGVGDARITATDRDDTVVDVRPSDDSNDLDVRVAEQTRVEYADGRLLIKAPKQRGLGLLGKVGSIDVTIDLPAGSHVRCHSAVGGFRAIGCLGECRVKTAAGDIELEQAGPADLNTGGGRVVVGHTAGHTEINTGTGKVRVRKIDSTAVIKNSNGDNWVGEITGDLRVSAANGDISVDRAKAGVTAGTANGDIRIGEVARGSAELRTACGAIEIGIHDGTAARLDVQTGFGRVRNEMAASDHPGPSEETVEVNARTEYGDIMIRRAVDF